MRVLIDGVVFETTHQKGIRRYFEEVLSRTEEDFSILLENALAGHIPVTWDLIQPLGPPARRIDPIRRRKYVNRAREREARIRSCAIYHATWFRLCPVPGIPTVVTVYDMVSEAMPGLYYGDATGDSTIKRRAIEAADAIITISETTKRDLLKLFPGINVPVYAIPLGADHVSVGQDSAIDGSGSRGDKPYALFVGDRMAYKNFRTLLDAMRTMEWPADLKLKVAGPPFSPVEYDCLRLLDLEHQVEACGPVPKDELAKLYAKAAVFVFPSLFEGFGLPMLEAQTRGAPVVANDMAVFHEVGGDAFLPCDCRSPVAIAGAVARTLEPATRASLIEAGRRNVGRFSWAETAKRTQQVWRQVADLAK